MICYVLSWQKLIDSLLDAFNNLHQFFLPQYNATLILLRRHLIMRNVGFGQNRMQCWFFLQQCFWVWTSSGDSFLECPKPEELVVEHMINGPCYLLCLFWWHFFLHDMIALAVSSRGLCLLNVQFHDFSPVLNTMAMMLGPSIPWCVSTMVIVSVHSPFNYGNCKWHCTSSPRCYLLIHFGFHTFTLNLGPVLTWGPLLVSQNSSNCSISHVALVPNFNATTN
jgi:hypothetical protein